jgi:predicted ATPase
MGLAVVGDIIGAGDPRGLDVTGEAPNLAAQLQSLAEPNAVLISDELRYLMGSTIEAQDLGQKAIKGWSEPLRIWRVKHVVRDVDRFGARITERYTPMVGRANELATLLKAWRAAQRGRGSALLVSGDAGIGKSRLVAHFAESISAESNLRLRYHSDEQGQVVPLHPFIAQIERAANFTIGDAPTAKLDKVRKLLVNTEEQDLALIGALLGIPFEHQFSHLTQLSPQVRRLRTLQALVQAAIGMARNGPVLATLEDAHWCDPSSMELLRLLVPQIAKVPILLIVTSRPGLRIEWNSEEMSLDPLPILESTLLVKTLAGSVQLPNSLVSEIVASGDGVPLYLEEITHAILAESKGSSINSLRPREKDSRVPASLRALLTSRLDQTGSAREVLCAAAIVGREFSFEMLRRVLDSRPKALRQSLRSLVEARLFQERKTGRGEYRFKHALLQAAAYSMMTRNRRAMYHERIATVWEADWPQIGPAQPQVIAHHWIEAGVVGKAVDWCIRAGTEAFRRLSGEEAISQLRRGLDLLEGAQDGEWRRRSELALCLLIGKAQLATRGHADREASATFARARAQCNLLGNPPELLSVLFAQWSQSLVRAEYAVALRQGEEMLAVGESRNDDIWAVTSCFAIDIDSDREFQ